MNDVGRTIVVGYASTAASRRAVQEAARLATDLDAVLHVVHVVDLRDYPVDPDTPDWDSAGEARLMQERREVEGLLAEHRLDWTYDLLRGDPARGIADTAARHHAYMIVVGTHVRHGFTDGLERLLGAGASVAHALERMEIPVLLVPSHSPKVGPAGDPQVVPPSG